jgi:peptidyl-prolyl cis-trans isomerase C
MRSMISSIFLPLSLLVGTANAADAPVTTVNGQPLKQSWVEVVKQDFQQSANQADDKAVQALLLKNELLAQEAVRLGIDKRPEFAAREEIRHRELLANMLINDTLKNSPITEEMLKAEYENFKKQVGDKEYSARHIQLQTEAEAKDVIAQLAKGADFAKLAKDRSADTRSRDNGGSIGWFTKNALPSPLGEAAAKLQKGLFTTVPLQSPFGWHVLKLEDVRDFQPPSFEKVKDQLRNHLKQRQIARLVENLRSKAKIETVK